MGWEGLIYIPAGVADVIGYSRFRKVCILGK